MISFTVYTNSWKEWKTKKKGWYNCGVSVYSVLMCMWLSWREMKKQFSTSINFDRIKILWGMSVLFTFRCQTDCHFVRMYGGVTKRAVRFWLTQHFFCQNIFVLHFLNHLYISSYRYTCVRKRVNKSLLNWVLKQFSSKVKVLPLCLYFTFLVPSTTLQISLFIHKNFLMYRRFSLVFTIFTYTYPRNNKLLQITLLLTTALYYYYSSLW